MKRFRFKPWLLGIVLVAGLFTPSTCPGAVLRILSYNIHHGEGTDGKLDLARVADVIRSARPDLVALQEVDNQTERTRKVDQAAELGRLTEMHAVFGKAMDYSGGQYGAAVLSRWPLQSTNASVLPASVGHEPRPGLIVQLGPESPIPGLIFVSTHLDHQSESERLTQAKRLLELLSEKTGPTILAGDINAVPQSRVLALFEKPWKNATGGQPLPTIPSERPVRQIDYVLCRPGDRFRVIGVKAIESIASDHCALLAVLEMDGDTRPAP